MTQPSPEQRTSLQVRRLFAAPRERVFNAWIEREALQKWLRPAGMTLTVSRLDAHVGGGFRFELKASDGRIVITTGKYLEINIPEKLVFTWITTVNKDDETVVNIEFVEREASTEVILTHDRITSDAMVAFFEQGWIGLLDLLAGAVE